MQNLFQDITRKDSVARNQTANISTASMPTTNIDGKPTTSNNPSAYKGHISQQSLYGPEGFGKLAKPQNRANQKNRDVNEDRVEPAISARDNNAELIQNMEQDKDWVQIQSETNDQSQNQISR